MTSEGVSVWLESLFAGAEQQPDIDLWGLMKQATHRRPEVPESDVAGRLGGWPDVPDIALVVDWIEFGQLLRKRLGWETYPEWPSQPATH
jgi:hypothetical protein